MLLYRNTSIVDPYTYNTPQMASRFPSIAAPGTLRRGVKQAYVSVLVLLAATVILLLWNRFGMERIVELSAASGVPVVAEDDRQDGGATHSTLSTRDGNLRLACTLIKKFDWPYCKFVFQLSSDTTGIDLSAFSFMTMEMSISGPSKNIKIDLINFEGSRSRAEDWLSYKVNEVEAIAVPASGKMKIPLNVFQTAQWWRQKRLRPIEDTAVSLDRVVRVEILTAGENPLGDYVMELKNIRFHGKLISQNHLLLGLITCWIGLALSWLGIAGVTLNRQLDHSHQDNLLLRQINNALELETKELTGQAYVDPLTGALNRQGLRAALIESSSMLANPMAIVFADIDHFKAVNDNFGHSVGDAVLQDFARLLRTRIRAGDKLVRWGGEEFLIVCTGTDALQAVQLANKLRHALHSHTWSNGLAVTASFGVTQRRLNEDIGDVIKRADEKLYVAKANGRDRIEADSDWIEA